MKNLNSKVNSIKKTSLKIVEDLFKSGNLSQFKGCVELYRLYESGKINRRELSKFYSNIGVSKDYGGRLKRVGKELGHFSGDHVSAYSLSHLVRLAALGDLGIQLITWKIVYKVEILDFISVNKHSDRLKGCRSPDIFHNNLCELKYEKRGSKDNERSVESKSDLATTSHQSLVVVNASIDPEKPTKKKKRPKKIGDSQDSIEQVSNEYHLKSLIKDANSRLDAIESGTKDLNANINDLVNMMGTSQLLQEDLRILNRNLPKIRKKLKACRRVFKDLNSRVPLKVPSHLDPYQLDNGKFIGTSRN